MESDTDSADAPTPAPPAGGDTLFESTIRGNSMAPAIPAGSRLRVRALAGPICKPGDIAYYLSPSGFLVHRIVHQPRRRAAQAHLLTLGDNCLIPDPPVRMDRILGVVVAFHTGGEWQQPGPLVTRSVFHRLARCTACCILIAASWFGVSTARRFEMALRKFESKCRAPVGSLLRRLHLFSSKR